MISLAALLSAHDQHRAEGALSAALGDGYLLVHSFVYRHLRAAALRAGFRYSSSPPFPYSSLPLACLEDIVSQRCIPFYDNVTALRRLDDRAPGALSLDDAYTLGVRLNVTLHESVHCVARTLGRTLTEGASNLDETQQRLLELLFEESCANATEAVCRATGSTELFASFIRMNCYSMAPGLRDDLERFGFKNTLRTLIIAFLCANFLYKDIDSNHAFQLAERIVDRHALSDYGKKQVRKLFLRALELNRAFRLKTTAIQLRLAGFEGTIFKLLAFDFSEELREGQRLRCLIDAMADLVELGEQSPAALLLEPGPNRRSSRGRAGSRWRSS